MKNYSRPKKNWPRYILQWGTLAALVFFLSGLAQLLFPKMEPADPETLCPLGGLEALATYGVRGSLPCSMSSLQVMMGIALAAAVILFSKLFCGYLCPVGTLQDLLLKLRNKLKIKAISIRNGSVVSDTAHPEIVADEAAIEEPIKTAPSGYYYAPSEDAEIEEFLQTYGTQAQEEPVRETGDISFAAAGRGSDNAG